MGLASTLLCAVLCLLSISHGECSITSKGTWKLLKKSIGISAMHMALLPNNKMIVFDRTDFGPSNISLPGGKCRQDDHDQALKRDCYAHSVEFDLASRSVRPLTVLTDTWCSSGSLAPDGTLIQTGGFNDGDHVVRYFAPCPGCDWTEHAGGLAARRWYSSNHILPNGKIIVVGGRKQFNYEFLPKSSPKDSSVFSLPFLAETTDACENNLYPFVHLSTDGNLFIFANDRAILLDYVNHRVVRKFPVMPGGFARNYPSTGSSTLLPLLLKDGLVEAEVLVCGGTPPDSNAKANKKIFVPAASTCGRLRISNTSPEWQIEEMPLRRVMGDMIMLPTGDVLILNGAAKGTAGWGVAREPVLNPVLYQTGSTYELHQNKFDVLNPSSIPRLYHSTAHLLPDGRVLVGGSNPNTRYKFTAVLFPTELSLEVFSPPYLSLKTRPVITSLNYGSTLNYKQRFTIEFTPMNKVQFKFYLTMVAPTFTTHSFSMNQRVLVLEVARVYEISGRAHAIDGLAPASAVLAPPGYYLLYVVQSGVPSQGKWVHIS